MSKENIILVLHFPDSPLLRENCVYPKKEKPQPRVTRLIKSEKQFNSVTVKLSSEEATINVISTFVSCWCRNCCSRASFSQTLTIFTLQLCPYRSLWNETGSLALEIRKFFLYDWTFDNIRIYITFVALGFQNLGRDSHCVTFFFLSYFTKKL